MSARDDAKKVICDIVAASGGRLEGRVRLYKAFYFAHLFFWEESEGVLTDHPIVRMPQGPGIDDGEALVDELVAEKRLSVSYQNNGPFKETVFELPGRYEIDPSDPRHRAIAEAVRLTEGQSATDLSRLTHELSRSWIAAKNGDVLDVYSDCLDDAQYRAVKNGVQGAGEMLRGIFD